MKESVEIRSRGKIVARFLALMLFVLAGLSACGGGNEKEAGDKASDTLRIALPGEIASLDITQSGGIIDYYVASISQEGLVAVTSEGKLAPALAETWETTDNRIWKFKLREGVQFHDGTPMTADDVVFSVNRAKDPESAPGIASYFPPYVEKVVKTGDLEVTFTLDGSHPGFLWNMSNAGILFVTSKKFAESAQSYGSSGDLILGTGPYRATEFEPGSHATFTRTDDWWGDARSDYKTIRFDFIQDPNTRLLAFQQGEIDFTYNVPLDQAEQWEAVEGATVQFVSDRSYAGLTFNPGIKPFDDIHVRRAISYAIDKEGIVGGLLKGHATAATAITPPEQFSVAWDSKTAEEKLSSVTHYEYDMEKAKAEMALSGVKDGFTATITCPGSELNAIKASLAIAESLKPLGITLEIQEIPLEQWLAGVGNGKQGIAWMIYTPTTGEPAEIIAWLLYADGQSNPAHWKDEETLKLTERAYGAPSNEAQADLVIQANDKAGKQAIYTPVFWGQSGIAMRKGVTIEGYNSYTLVSNWPSLFKTED